MICKHGIEYELPNCWCVWCVEEEHKLYKMGFRGGRAELALAFQNIVLPDLEKLFALPAGKCGWRGGINVEVRR